jgi:hypothetical protein
MFTIGLLRADGSSLRFVASLRFSRSVCEKQDLNRRDATKRREENNLPGLPRKNVVAAWLRRENALAKTLLLALVALGCAAPRSVVACAVCYGQSDSPMAYGFNAGIITLLAVVVAVLGSIAGFFFYLAKRASAMQPGASPQPQPPVLIAPNPSHGNIQ